MTQSKSVLITGASTGIGQASAFYLSDKGFQVFASVRNEEDADLLVKESSGKIHPLIFDLTDYNARDQAIHDLKEQLSGNALYAIINNAALMWPGPLEFYPIPKLREHFEINLVGTIALIQACLPMIRASKGRIINISSAQERLPTPFFGPYTISKLGMRALHQVLRLELMPWAIECVLIIPGAVKTPMWKKFLNNTEDSFLETSEARELYGNLYRAMIQGAADMYDKSIPANTVARAIEKALTDKRPKPEITVGPDAKFFCTPLGRFSTRVREKILSTLLKLPK